MATFHDFTRSYITFPQTYTIPRWKHSIDLYRIYAFCEAYLNSDPQMGFLEGAPEINHHGHGHQWILPFLNTPKLLEHPG